MSQALTTTCLLQFTKRSVIDTYTAFINNWKTAKEAIKSTCQAKPAFARYLEVSFFKLLPLPASVFVCLALVGPALSTSRFAAVSVGGERGRG